MFRHSAGDCITWVSGSDSELIGFVFFFFLFLPLVLQRVSRNYTEIILIIKIQTYRDSFFPCKKMLERLFFLLLL